VTRTDSWLRRYAPRPAAATRVFCLPHAGGSASSYRGWAAGSPWDVEFVAVQYPGHEDLSGLDPVPMMHDLADGVAEEVRGLSDLPFLLFGHSMGAVVAFEAARRLQASGARGPERLMVSGRPAPHRSRPGVVHLGTDDDLAAELTRLGGTRESVLSHPGLREFVLPIMRHDYRLAETYQPQNGPALRAPITVLYADADPEVTRADAEAWNDATDGPCEVLAFSGGHFYISPRGEPVIAAVLDRARAACPVGPRWPSTP
jgi:pyochelin biosynthetic protein PchC